MQTIGLVFAYFGPETVMPVTSIIATVAAVVMMFGKTIVRFTLGWIRTILVDVRVPRVNRPRLTSRSDAARERHDGRGRRLCAGRDGIEMSGARRGAAGRRRLTPGRILT